jgi:hypothetical protein
VPVVSPGLLELIARAERGDKEALPDLRAELDGNAPLWAAYGDLSRRAESAWLDLVAGGNLMLKESLMRCQEAARAELAGPAASPLARALGEAVLASTLQLNYASAIRAQLATERAPAALIDAAERRLDGAQKRLLRAAATLATAKRLLPAEFDLESTEARPVRSAVTAPALSVVGASDDGRVSGGRAS